MTTSNISSDVAMDESDSSKTKEPDKHCNMNEVCEMKDTLKEVHDSPSSNEAGSSVNTSNNGQYKPMAIKKKHRRGSRRSKKKYKPYSKLTWEEKKAVEERDSLRAVSIREKYMHEKGRPLAPFNTSQFLMAEHDTQEPDLHVHRVPRFSSSADDSDDADSASISDEERDIEGVRNFLQKDFTETYDRIHSETLRRMNKEELINEYVELENKVENLEKELTTIKSGVKVNGYITPGNDENNRNVDTDQDWNRQTLEHEIEKLREENQRLNAENTFLRPLAAWKEVSSN
ncbi:protein HEXIM-like [Dendronephthya gigantea]|uniref:protein HEXIM-like n=1 Tax=Dendronephthya gigantea TaxID=151771 RepID=UPI00106BA2D1|nr:protein HEXIM-like [Dendronephthya gigantea]